MKKTSLTAEVIDLAADLALLTAVAVGAVSRYGMKQGLGLFALFLFSHRALVSFQKGLVLALASRR